jgi:signal transduction histidine kinase
MRQVFWNLALNAIRAMPAGGTLRIEACLDEDAGQVTFHDDGVGMTREQQEQLFQPFQSGFPGGAGLGLSIVFQIVDDHGGSIRIDSEKGRGTRVIVALPLAKAAAPPAPQPVEAHA